MSCVPTIIPVRQVGTLTCFAPTPYNMGKEIISLQYALNGGPRNGA